MSILIAGVLISGSIIYLVGSQKGGVQGGTGGEQGQLAAVDAPKNLPQLLSVSEGDVILGDPDAPVTFLEYGDYQCPFCGRLFSQVEPKLREEYVKTGKVKMVYRDFAFLGPESFAAGEAAGCAKDQQKFWAYHDLIYREETTDGREHNGNLNRDLFLRLAGELNLDAQAFASCIDSRKYKDFVEQQSAEGRALGVDSTPTVFINGQQIRGALPYESFKSVIDGLLGQG